MSFLKSLRGNKPAPEPPASAAAQGSRLSYQRILESFNEKEPAQISVRRCDVCGASYAHPDRFANLATTNIAEVALDLGGYCPQCLHYVCPRHAIFAQNPAGGQAANAGSWRPACATCGTFLVYPKVELIRIDGSMVTSKGHRRKVSLKGLLEGRGISFQTKTCGECGQTLQHPVQDFLLARADRSVGPADFLLDVGGHCQCCGYYVCGDHAVLFEHEDEGRLYMSLTCATCDEIPLTPEVRKVEPMPGVTWTGCFHRQTKKAIENAMKAFSAPAKPTYSFAALFRQNNVPLKDHRCDVCGKTFQKPDVFIRPQMDLKTAEDNHVGEDSFIADIGGYCHGCKKYLCPAHVGVFSTDHEGRRLWLIYCESCVQFLTPDEHTPLTQG